jgi:L-lactate dehydrogenase (cytochrome)/(S)-mandelate dehydrogenase
VELMLDSGVRRGSDILIGICLGARFAFFGRPTLYAAAAGGMQGIEKAIEIVRNEVDMVMAQIGCASLEDLHSGYLYAGAKESAETQDGQVRRPMAKALG